MTGSLDRAALARFIDHTLLAPEATTSAVNTAIELGRSLGVWAVCISPSFLPVAAGGVRIATVCGFPSGKHHGEIKAAEAARAVADGADEVDMVIDVGAALSGNWEKVHQEIRAVRAATEGHVLKVIIESACLTDEQIVAACRQAADAGADFVKTSTGFHPAGGASARAVSIMSETVGGRLGVKASGGIRTLADALDMLDHGATRLGLSGTEAILAEM